MRRELFQVLSQAFTSFLVLCIAIYLSLTDGGTFLTFSMWGIYIFSLVCVEEAYKEYVGLVVTEEILAMLPTGTLLDPNGGVEIPEDKEVE